MRCASVGEVLDLIVEKEEGEDLFVKNKGQALLLRQEEQQRHREYYYKNKREKLVLIKAKTGELVFVKHAEDLQP